MRSGSSPSTRSACSSQPGSSGRRRSSSRVAPHRVLPAKEPNPKESQMAYEVPPLPYDYDALEPHIDEATMRVPPRQAPPGLRGQGQRRARGHRVGRQADRGRHREPLARSRTTSAPRSATTAAATTTTRCSGSGCRPDGGGEPDGDLAAAIDAAFGSFADFQGKLKDAGVNQFGSGWAWLVHDGSGLAVVSHRQPGQPAHRRQDAAARRRRLGARLLPQVPEQAPGLHRRLVERRELGQGRRGLQLRDG